MTEAAKRIPIPDTDYAIHGLLRDADEGPLVVMAHCLTGSKNCLDMYIGARVLQAAGFASFRFDFYGFGDDQRDFLDCILDDHSDDLDLVIDTFRREQPGRRIVVIGHSIGAAVILKSKKRSFEGVAFWDPTHSGVWTSPRPEDDPWSHYEWIPSCQIYRSRGGVEHVVTKQYLDSYRFIDTDQLASELEVPVKVIIAGSNTPQNGVSLRRGMYDRLREPKSLTVIDDADHCFTNGETMTALHNATIEWLQNIDWSTVPLRVN